jgi:transcriptional regulator with XRE-family HTH domain
MAPAKTNPMVRRWELAAHLRDLRVQAGRTIEEAAAELMCSVAKISRMERAGRGVQPRDVRDLCRFYAVDDATRDELMELAVEARKAGWWQDFRALDEQLLTFIALESAATEIRTFEALRVPGLFQTAEFTAAVLPQTRPPGELTPERIDETARARAHRQERVTAGDLSVRAIIDEAALRRPIGGPEVIADQVRRLLADAVRPNVELQVIPFARGPHPGIEGSFSHLSFGTARVADLVYVEGLLGNFLLDQPGDVGRYRQVFEDLGGRVALSIDETLHWLDSLLYEMTSQ